MIKKRIVYAQIKYEAIGGSTRRKVGELKTKEFNFLHRSNFYKK